ncbi:cytochrome P450 [Stereum hirsutum FP-91666 SS1]|uniref:cytochrome P450 n=1 Tax=Stereum hirsutum (strain FP-91666) TaxID=721885 RepID=UPI000440FE09|nr:cytochrome P450 [Stereum hirsutum FP-91666 SS1]EIM87513.1 cytochrome P450 [Stereum hirsutum FP-91666 SS1]
MGFAITALSLLSALVTAAIIPLLYKFIPSFWRSLRSPVNDVPGPESGHFLWGNLKQISDADALVLHEEWVATYGPIVKYKMMFNESRLMMMDNRAINFVLSNSSNFQKPQTIRNNLGRLFGQGVLFAEGEDHRQQRRILNPAFGPVYLRDLTEIFLEKSGQLRDLWTAEISKSTDETTKVNIVTWLNKTTLDIIGLAGFNYSFNALAPDDQPNELNDAIRNVLKFPSGFPIFAILRNIFPILSSIPSKRGRDLAHAHATMARIGKELIAEKKASALAEAGNGSSTNEKGHVLRDHVKGKDILSLLVKANMAEDLPEALRLSDDDVMAQVPTFLIAGHETTSSAVTWALWALAGDQECQTKLRANVLSVSSDTPTMDELNGLSCLDHVVRETMRIHAPVTSTLRIATHDDVIPTDHEWTDRHGITRREVRVNKGDTIFIPILAINRSKELWGEDASEFKPERWDNLPEAVRSIPGVWGNSLSFLGGARACIGYRFSIIEMKAMLFTLIRAFEFNLAIPREDIIKKSAIVQRPYIKNDVEAGTQLPLLISVAKSA